MDFFFFFYQSELKKDVMLRAQFHISETFGGNGARGGGSEDGGGGGGGWRGGWWFSSEDAGEPWECDKTVCFTISLEWASKSRYLLYFFFSTQKIMYFFFSMQP